MSGRLAVEAKYSDEGIDNDGDFVRSDDIDVRRSTRNKSTSVCQNAAVLESAGTKDSLEKH